MQPYFLPYIGYWQLINSVDLYVIYDDVNYKNRGWINRNRILIDGKPRYYNIPLIEASQNKLINEVRVDQNAKIFTKNLRTIECVYKKAPCFEKVFPLIKEILYCEEENIALFLANSINIVCRYLDIQTKLKLSSSVNKNCDLKGQEKILAICEQLGATEYFNAIGGQGLYTSSVFEERGIKLRFLKTNVIEYKQFDYDFQPNLSILDVMMFNSKETIKSLLHEYRLL